MYLYRVESYLQELDRAPDGWDFEGDRAKYAERVKHEIRADLITALPLGLDAGRKRVEHLLDEWLANYSTVDSPARS